MKKRVINFGVVGIFNTILNVLVFNILIFLDMRIDLANFISVCLSIVVAYILSSRIVFSDRTNNELTRNRFAKFILVNIFTLFIIHQLILFFFAFYFTVPGWLLYQLLDGYLDGLLSQTIVEANTAKLFAVLGSMMTSYILYDKLVFKAER